MRKAGVLVISHGSRSAGWVKLVDEAVARAALPEAFAVPVESAFLELVDGRLIQDGIDSLEARGITDILAVPLFISSGSTHVHEIGYALGVRDYPSCGTELRPFRVRSRIHYAQPLDDDPEIAELLLENIRPLSALPAREIVMIVVHGSRHKGYHALWRRGLDRLADRLRRLGGFARVDGCMLSPDQAGCRMAFFKRKYPDYPVIVAPLFLSEGYFTQEMVPSRLRGFAYRYNGKALLPHPAVSGWLKRRVACLLNGQDGISEK